MPFQQVPLYFLIIDFPMFLFNISMIYFLLVQIRRKNLEFIGGFYKLFIVVSINDSVLYIESLLLTRFPTSGLFTQFYLGNSIWMRIWHQFGFTLNGFLTSFDILGHTTISFNRFSTLYLTNHYQYIWSGKRFALIIALLYGLSLLSVSYRIYGPFKYVQTEDGIALIYDSDLTRKIYSIDRTALNITTSIISFIFESLTAIKYRKIWKTASTSQSKAYHLKDIQLFIHSVMVFAAQCLMSAFFIIYLICFYNNYLALLHAAQQYVFIMFDLITLGAPVFLFIHCCTTILFGILWLILYSPNLSEKKD